MVATGATSGFRFIGQITVIGDKVPKTDTVSGTFSVPPLKLFSDGNFVEDRVWAAPHILTAVVNDCKFTLCGQPGCGNGVFARLSVSSLLNKMPRASL